MGTFRQPKKGRTRQSLGTARSKVLQTHAEMIHKVEAPSSQDSMTSGKKGKAWSLGKNTMKAR